jgi:UDP-N-acetyl-2-amino-2-deoxyglucuronate dehydrogenase
MGADVGKQWRSAVIGTNVVGVTHLRAISTTNLCTLAAVCDLAPARAKGALDKLGLGHTPVYESLSEMLRKEKLDVVHICTPSGAHLDCAMEAIKARVNVICEKPLEVTLERCDAMLEAAQKANVRIGGIFQYRWNEANAAIRHAVEEGRFGRVAWAGSFTPWWRPDEYFETGGWRGTWKMDGGGAIMNQSIHAIDLIHWFAGPVKTVCAFAGRRSHNKIEVEDTLSATVQFASGAFGTIMGTTALFPGAPVRVEIGGENGTAVSEDGLKVFKFREPRDSDAELLEKYGKLVSVTREALSNKEAIERAAEAKTKLHRQNIESILGAWQENREADTSGAEARKAVAITMALYESARKNGAPVDVK